MIPRIIAQPSDADIQRRQAVRAAARQDALKIVRRYLPKDRPQALREIARLCSDEIARTEGGETAMSFLSREAGKVVLRTDLRAATLNNSEVANVFKNFGDAA